MPAYGQEAGYGQGYQQGYGGPAGPPRNGLGTAALVLGILGLITSIFLIGGVLGLVAIILGFVALGRVRRGQATNRGVSIAGIVLGVLALAIAVIVGITSGSILFKNKDNISNFNSCVKMATTQQQRDDCQQKFQNDVQNTK